MIAMFQWLSRLLRQQSFARWFGAGLALLAPFVYTVLVEVAVRTQGGISVPAGGGLSRIIEWQYHMMDSRYWISFLVFGWCAGICILIVTLCVFIATRITRDWRLSRSK